MNISRTEAEATLDDIGAVAAAVRQSLIYRVASSALIWWGALVAAGNLTSQFQPRVAGFTWIAVNIVGVVGTILLVLRAKAGAGEWRDPRPFVALGLFYGFGLLWSLVLAKFGGRELCTFWPTLFMFGYCLAGIWLGRAFIVLGLAVTALTITGYLLIFGWFNIYLAVVNGAGLMCCGLWMRRT
jgi:hypothetical protein